jgi:quinol monooxygenase YgiN
MGYAPSSTSTSTCGCRRGRSGDCSPSMSSGSYGAAETALPAERAGEPWWTRSIRAIRFGVDEGRGWLRLTRHLRIGLNISAIMIDAGEVTRARRTSDFRLAMPAQMVLVADVHGRVGLMTELRGLLDDLADASRAEPECVEFRVLAGDDPGELVLLSVWRDEAALRAHYDSSHYRRYRAQETVSGSSERCRRLPGERRDSRPRPQPPGPRLLRVMTCQAESAAPCSADESSAVVEGVSRAGGPSWRVVRSDPESMIPSGST